MNNDNENNIDDDMENILLEVMAWWCVPNTLNQLEVVIKKIDVSLGVSKVGQM